MKRFLTTLLATVITLSGFGQVVIPTPKKMEYLSQKLVKLKSVDVKIIPTEGAPSEQYTLKTKRGKAIIIAQSKQAEVWGLATLRQLTDKNGCLPEVEIVDYPAFALRGFMHDTGRNFRSIEQLKKEIDLFSLYKINVFHWHLTDNPAWRIECKAYPQLNDAKYQTKGRDEGKFYTYEQIREIIAYAKERGVMILPEIDMPGHSAYFNRTFGFSMATPQGMEVLEKCLKEWFEEIPKEDCPYLHIGSDEVRVADPEGFMAFCENLVTQSGRIALAWDPGLPASKQTICQLWRGEMYEKLQNGGYDHKYIDSYMGYLNNSCPIINTSRLFLHQTCATEEQNEQAVGAILCLWNDVRVADKDKTFPHNGMPEGLLSFAESCWRGGEGYNLKYEDLIPAPDTQAHKDLVEFEKKIIHHRDNLLYDWNMRWVANAHIPWRVTLPAPKGTPIEQMQWAKAWGGAIELNSFAKANGVELKPQMEAWLETEIYVERDTTIKAMIGFESPSRANRLSSGIGEQGRWEAESRVFVGEKEIFPDFEWQEPKAYRYLYNTWGAPANELPYTDEQLFWTRTPASVPLKAGWNKIRLYAPRHFNINCWVAAFIPVGIDENGHLREAEGLKFR